MSKIVPLKKIKLLGHTSGPICTDSRRNIKPVNQVYRKTRSEFHFSYSALDHSTVTTEWSISCEVYEPLCCTDRVHMSEVWCFHNRRRQYSCYRGTGEVFSLCENRKKVPRFHACVLRWEQRVDEDLYGALAVKRKYSKEKLSQCHCVDHICHMDWPEIEPVSPMWESAD
jgi:hypothetical protein